MQRITIFSEQTNKYISEKKPWLFCVYCYSIKLLLFETIPRKYFKANYHQNNLTVNFHCFIFRTASCSFWFSIADPVWVYLCVLFVGFFCRRKKQFLFWFHFYVYSNFAECKSKESHWNRFNLDNFSSVKHEE